MAASVWATIQDGELVIRVPVRRPPYQESSSGKTLLVASTGGNVRTGIRIPLEDGDTRELIVGVNAYVYREPR